jgi:hypothetical protein
VAAADKDIDRLYELPPEEFTAARNELTRRLKAEGDRDAADAVGALKKPTVPVWALNRAARRDRPAVKELLGAAAGLRKAQERALAGRGADALRDAQQRERDAVRRVTEEARRLLEEDGRSVPIAQVERIERTAAAAALGEDTRKLLAAGRLTHELQPAGFDSLAGLSVPAGGAVRRTGTDPQRARREAEEKRQRRALEQEHREAERRAEAAEREAVRAEDAARTARARADKARRRADAAAAALAGSA